MSTPETPAHRHVAGPHLAQRRCLAAPPTAISKASSAAISPSTSPGARSRPPRLRVSPGRQQPATGRAGDRLRLRQPGSHRTACRGRPRNLADRPGVDGLHHVLSALRGGPAAAIAALDQQRPRRLEHRHRAAGPRELRPGRDARCGAALRARRRVHPAGARPVGQLPREALLVDRESGRYADVSRVHPVDHDGEFLKVKGPLNLPAFGEARIPWCRPAPPRAGATSPPRWPTWCSRRPRTRRLPWNCAATFPPRRTPRSLAARRAPAAGLQPVPGGEPRGGAGNLHADPRAPGPHAQVRHDQADARPRPQRLAAGPADFRGRPAAAGGQPRQPHPHSTCCGA